MQMRSRVCRSWNELAMAMTTAGPHEVAVTLRDWIMSSAMSVAAPAAHAIGRSH
jgi:hypothetical protein